MNDDEADDLDPVDRAALELALTMTLEEKDRGRVEQVKSMLAEQSWYEVASFCAYHRQIGALRLKPWESPPVHLDRDDSNTPPAAVRLMRRMEVCGVSIFHPDPIQACDEAERGPAHP